mgnify:CR=1 FL=1
MVSAAGDGGVGCRCQHACYMVLGGVMLPTSRVAAVAAALHEVGMFCSVGERRPRHWVGLHPVLACMLQM